MNIKVVRLLLFLLLLCDFARANDQIRVLDGDSIVLNGEHVRLKGIDAPEYNQICYNGKEEVKCGQNSKKFLQKLIKGQIKCEKEGLDKYNRWLATCYCNNKDLAEQMVLAGQALSYAQYGDDYGVQQKQAMKNKKGIWKTKFMNPSLYRVFVNKE